MDWHPVTVRRLRVRTRGRDSPPVRSRLRRAIEALPGQSEALPRDAILCIRRLTDPLPGGWRVSAGDAQPTAAWASRWQAVLEDRLRHAARPARGVVPAGAEAALFADSAELLACLARDWLQGTGAEAWWWSVLFPSTDLATALQQAWLRHPGDVPAALRTLGLATEAPRFLAALPSPMTQQLLHRVVAAFALERLAEGWDGTLNSNRDVEIRREGQDQGIPFRPTESAIPGSGVQFPPWSRWLSIPAGLSSPVAALLITAAMLDAAPGMLRSEAFANEVHAWRRSEAIPDAVLVPAHEESDARLPAGGTAPAMPSPEANRNRSATTEARRAGARQVTCKANEAGQPWRAAARLEGTASQAAVPPIAATPAVSAGLALTKGSAGLHVPDTTVPGPLDLPTRIETCFGGVFYLTNILLSLGLYGDFTQPRRPGLAMPIWDAFALITCRWCPGTFPSDPVWNLLAQLAGRNDQEPPGAYFTPPSEWRPPAAWWDSLPQGNDWQWYVRDDRLTLLHSLGGCVLTFARNGETIAVQLAHELRTLGITHSPTEISPPPQADSGPLDRWLDWLIPWIDVRLAAALGLADSVAAQSLLLDQAATVDVTSSRVDVRFRLAAHPVTLRFAGLDRDPGWVPSAGRSIFFHYD